LKRRNLKFLRRYQKSSLKFIQRCCYFDTLNENELDGHYTYASRLKLIKFSQHLLPMRLGRSIRGEAFSQTMVDPFASCFSKLELENPKSIDAFHKTLFEYYNFEQGKSWKDFILSSENTSKANEPCWTIRLPWEKLSISEMKKNYIDMLFKNRRERGLSFGDDTYELGGFYSLEAAKNQAELSYDLLKKLHINGWDFQQPRPKVFILVENNSWKWMMAGDGNHRMYAMNRLNYEMVPAEIVGVISKNRVKTWNNVKNKTYHPDEAKMIFDLAFSGKGNLRGIV